MSLDHFYLNRLRFTIQARESILLPAFKGTTLRGGFGIAFRQLVCYQPEVSSCKECLLRFTCPYPRLFETYVPPDATVLSNLERVTTPIVIQSPLDSRRELAPGDTLTFHVTLVGQADRYLSYLVVAFQELGRRGLGKTRGRFKLLQVKAVHPYTAKSALIYDSNEAFTIRSITLPVRYEECLSRAKQISADQIRIRFVTPTRLKDRGEVIHEESPPFHVIWRALMRRVSSLSYFHCHSRWEADYRELAETSRSVELVDGRTRWEAATRYSSRQGKRLPIGGVIGEVEYAGDFKPFLPLLLLGELVHVGKGTVFGNGQIQIEGIM